VAVAEFPVASIACTACEPILVPLGTVNIVAGTLPLERLVTVVIVVPSNVIVTVEPLAKPVPVTVIVVGSLVCRMLLGVIEILVTTV
jgi:hypothetical protein